MEANILNPLDSMSSAPQSNLKNKEMGKEEFLKLLSVQLQHQDPLNPLDNSEFIAQLAQFSSLEGITNMSVSMDSMSEQIIGMNNMNAASLIGKAVKVPGNGLELGASGTAPVEYELSKDAAKVTVSIFNESGVLMGNYDTGSVRAGKNTFTWNGTDMSGNAAPAGSYTFSVAAAGIDGASVNVKTLKLSAVEGVVYEGDTPYLMVGGEKVEISSLQEIWGR